MHCSYNHTNQSGRLYYLNYMINSRLTARSNKDWHQKMGHSNTEGLYGLESAVDGMKIQINLT